MESLYRKYRPLTFEDVVGQQHIVSTLEHAVTEGRLSHAYLFCGPRGTGKTTMARILAKALLCQHADQARAQGASGCMPDGTCPECKAIAEGTHPDVYELDAASRTGVDSVREEIISSVNFAPVRGAYKVYIIDEVHMLTTAAFNALLKTLEEPPSHVVFILCTTDPQKILETILSRCQRFDFHRISNEDIVGRLRFICGQEGFDADDEALEIVARHARGGMRDALSTLEQLSVFGDGAVRAADARALLGEVSGTVLAEFAKGIADRDVAGLFGMIRMQVEEGNDLLEFTRDAVAHIRDVYTARVAGGAPELFDKTPEEVASLVEEAGRFESPDRVARVLTVLDDAAIEMRSASDARLVLEIACTRLARPESDLTLEALAERLDRIEAQLAAGVPSAPMGGAGIAALTGSAMPAAEAPVSRVQGRVRLRSEGGSGGAVCAAAAADRLSQGASTVRAVAQAPMPAPATSTAPAAESAARTQIPPAASVAETASRPTRREQPVATADGPQRRSTGTSAQPSSASQPDRAPVRPSSEGPVAPVASEAVQDAGELQRRWAEVVKRVTADQASRGALLQSSRARSDDGSRLVIGFPKGSNFAIKMLGRADSHDLIMPIVQAVFGARGVDYVMDGAAPVPAPGPASPSAEAASAAQAPSRAGAPSPARPESAQAASAPKPPRREAAPASSDASPASVSPSGAEPSFAHAVPAPAPQQAPGSAQAAPVPAAQRDTPVQVDEVSGPTIVPEPDVDADRRAWEDEQVPYDDAMIAAYDDEEVPPFDLPGEPAGAAASARRTTSAAPAPASSAGAGAPPWAASAAATVQESQVPKSEDEAKAMLEGIFGNVVFK